MSKPEDIEQEAWQVAQDICDQACMPEHYYINGVVTAVQTDIARAILAAEKRGEEREREACAVVAEMGHWEHRIEGRFHTGHSYAVWCGPHGPMIASTIRARSTP